MYSPARGRGRKTGFRRASVLPAVFLLVQPFSTVYAGDKPEWIWLPGSTPASTCFFRKSFDAPVGAQAVVEVTADDVYELFLNGRFIGRNDEWAKLMRYDVAAQLEPGRNQLALRCQNGEGPAGLALKVTVVKGLAVQAAKTDASWRVAAAAPEGWQAPTFNDSAWQTAAVLGVFGEAAPWGKIDKVSKTIVVRSPARRAARGEAFLDGDHVALVGSAFLERDGREGYLETELVRRCPRLNLHIRNFGWSGDTVLAEARSYFGPPEEGIQRLRDGLQAFSPTIVVASYGANESYAGAAGLADFREHYQRLLNMLADETGAAAVLLAPCPLEDHGPPLPSMTEPNRRIRLYRNAVAEVARIRKAKFVDLTSMIESAAIGSRDAPATTNGVHYSAYGYWRVAPIFAEGVGAPATPWRVQAEASSGRVTANGAAVTNAASTNGGLRFTLHDAALPPPPPPRDAPAAAAGFAARRLFVEGLPPGKYSLSIDDAPVATGDAEAWAGGIVVQNGPEFVQVEQLRRAIVQKNEWFFHRWRPENETYLFGFRKQEQGNNGVEIPQFDPWIGEAEAKIARLRVPVPHRYQIAPASENSK